MSPARHARHAQAMLLLLAAPFHITRRSAPLFRPFHADYVSSASFMSLLLFADYFARCVRKAREAAMMLRQAAADVATVAAQLYAASPFAYCCCCCRYHD